MLRTVEPNCTILERASVEARSVMSPVGSSGKGRGRDRAPVSGIGRPPGTAGIGRSGTAGTSRIGSDPVSGRPGTTPRSGTGKPSTLGRLGMPGAAGSSGIGKLPTAGSSGTPGTDGSASVGSGTAGTSTGRPARGKPPGNPPVRSGRGTSGRPGGVTGRDKPIADGWMVSKSSGTGTVMACQLSVGFLETPRDSQVRAMQVHFVEMQYEAIS